MKGINMNDINYEKDRIESVSQIDSVKSLSDKVIELKSVEDEINNAEKSISQLKEKAKNLSEFEIPKMMQEMNITKLKLKDGESVEIKPYYYASVAQGRGEDDSAFIERKSKAFNWLRDNGLGDIIKNDVTVTFGRDEDNKAIAYATLAKEQGFEPVQKETVHAITLKALVRERLESGKEMPSDLFKTYAGNSTKIKRR
tara:strand:+ start:8761 stop:9357 length:597 start_codon:yes stop_codon:yes gene_type:complete